MKLSELIDAAAGTDPEILILSPWGEMNPAFLLVPADLVEGDPILEDLAHLPAGTLVLTHETP
jgi:hypothetical protein